MRALLPMLALAGCATAGDTPQAELSRELAIRIAGEPRDCVTGGGSDGLVAVDDRTLTYRTMDTIWVNRLAGACPGIGPLSTLVVDRFGGRLCRGDRVRGIEAGQSIAGPPCPLASFVPYRRPG